MVSLIRLVQRWLWPAAADISTEAQDTSSMADLVRLLGTDSAPLTDGQGEKQGNRTDSPGS
ncbi:MAG TPA: hypothetical protein VF499_09080 [Afipia sp.]